MRKKARFSTEIPDAFINEIFNLIDLQIVNENEYLVFEIKLDEEIYKIDIGMTKQEQEKRCNRCDRVLPIECFYNGITRRSGSGKEAICKECRIKECINSNKKRAMMYRYKNKIKHRIIYTKNGKESFKNKEKGKKDEKEENS